MTKEQEEAIERLKRIDIKYFISGIMEEKQDYLSIHFNLKPPEELRQSMINTIVLLLRDINEMKNWKQWEEFDIIVFNDKIEQIKKELDYLQIKQKNI